MTIDIGNILGRAWKITWKNKALWIFGILAALGNGGGGGNGGNSSSSSGRDGSVNLPPEVERFLNQIVVNIVPVIIALICLILLISAVVLILSLLGRGGLIGGVRLADTNGQVTFGEAWGAARSNLVRLLILEIPNVILSVIVLISVLVPILGLVLTATQNRGSFPDEIWGVMVPVIFCAVCVICAAAIVGIALNILTHFARFAAVLEDQTGVAAFRRAWEMIKLNIANIIVLGIILIVIRGVAGVIIALPLILVAVPVVLGVVSGVAAHADSAIYAGLIIGGICCIAYVPVLLVLGGVLETWVTAAWTLTYPQFNKPAVDAAAPASLPV